LTPGKTAAALPRAKQCQWCTLSEVS
jgi:hypothetical protein